MQIAALDPSSGLEDLTRETLTEVVTSLDTRDLNSLSCVNRAFHLLMQDDYLWHLVAMKKWGPKVAELASECKGRWFKFCMHRLPHQRHTSLISPLDLIQEQFSDPWSHIASCLMCNRTTGGPTIRATVRAFLTSWPTPSAVLETSDVCLLTALKPLGLQVQRLAALRCMSHDFIAKNWEDPSEFKGCGRFVKDSWQIFCRGLRDIRKVEDANLSRYLRWLNGEMESKHTTGVIVARETGLKRKRDNASNRDNATKRRSSSDPTGSEMTGRTAAGLNKVTGRITRSQSGAHMGESKGGGK